MAQDHATRWVGRHCFRVVSCDADAVLARKGRLHAYSWLAAFLGMDTASGVAVLEAHSLDGSSICAMGGVAIGRDNCRLPGFRRHRRGPLRSRRADADRRLDRRPKHSRLDGTPLWASWVPELEAFELRYPFWQSLDLEILPAIAPDQMPFRESQQMFKGIKQYFFQSFMFRSLTP